MFVHGFAGHTHWWDWVAPAFQDRWTTVALDLSGMGDSEWRTGWPITAATAARSSRACRCRASFRAMTAFVT